MIARVNLQGLDEGRERALAVGGAAAVVWGVAVSLFVFSLGPEEIGWLEYAGLLVGGIAVLLALPPLFVVVRSWLRRRSTAL